MKWQKKSLFLIPIILFLFFFSQIHHQKDSVEKKEVESTRVVEVEPEKKEEKETETFTVDIKGSIQKPGVYTVEAGKRVMDVIHEAGGLLENANTSLINLSKKIQDEMVIIIYSNEQIEELLKKDEKIVYQIVEVEKECPDNRNQACIQKKSKEEEKEENEENKEEQKKININTATEEELTTIPGIGASKAANIIAYRTSFPFATIEQIKEVSGIGEALFEKIKDYIMV